MKGSSLGGFKRNEKKFEEIEKDKQDMNNIKIISILGEQHLEKCIL